MPLYVNTNVASLFAQRNLTRSTMGQQKALEKLSTGLRINSASDDAAGLAISDRFRSRIRSLEQAQRNANDGVSVIQTAEGSLEQMTNIIHRLRELSVQSANGSLTDPDRLFIEEEFQTLVDEVDRIAAGTSFNGRKLLNGSASTGILFQVGADNTTLDRITVSIQNTQASRLGTGGTKLNTQGVSTITKSQLSLGVIDAALAQISTARAGLGAQQNRLNVTIDNLGTSIENLSASNSRIRDADIAKETAALTKAQILVQAGVSVLAQANQSPQIALSLLQG